MKRGAETGVPPVRDRENPRSRMIWFRLSDPDYQTLVTLADYHRTTIARLVSRALPLVMEKYRVLRELHKRPEELSIGRRRG
jgi:hypothetical protein